MATYKTPGVYVEEISVLPPSVAEVETAIPAFMGFTEKGTKNAVKRIGSLMEYTTYFGSAEPDKSITVIVNGDMVDIKIDSKNQSKNVMYYAMQLYFANGGGPCYIVPTGNFTDTDGATIDAYTAALSIVAKEDEPTLLVFPDAPYVIPSRYNDLMINALQQCADLGDRFLIIDVLDSNNSNDLNASVEAFRNIATTTAIAKYGAAYFPYLNSSIPYMVDYDTLTIAGAVQAKAVTTGVEVDELDATTGKKDNAKKNITATDAVKTFSGLPNAIQNQIKQKIAEYGVVLTPCAAVAGVYASTDNTRGVWKAPANISLNYVKSTAIKITDKQQDDLNIDVDAGKSINAIRSFVGKGTRIWGARTLAGNDNEWRYINVRRFFNMVEESVKKSTGWAVFEPNDINTWTRVRAMIENYLLLKWKDGALAGAKPDDAYFVRVGLGQTMTPQDVLEGRMIVEIGLAAVKPAEFIILKFSHKLQTS